MNEPDLINIKENSIKKQRKILIIATVFVITLFIGSSYSLLTSNKETEEVITVTAGELKAELQNVDVTTLNGELPKSDEEGLNNNSIEINIKNTGTLTIGKYEVKLNKDTSKESTLDEQYIKYAISLDGKEYKNVNTLSETKNIIYTGYNLEKEKTIKIYLKLWLKEDAGEEILSKSYYGSINVELYQNDDRLPAADTLIEKVASEEDGIKGIKPETGELCESDCKEYRYTGPTVKNYVKLNNNGQEELWRIIGVFTDSETNERYMRLVRNEVLPTEMLPANYKKNEITYNIKKEDKYSYWNNSNSTGKNNWSEAGLQYYLNEEDDANGNKGYMSYLSSETKSLLQERTHYLGSVIYGSSGDTTIMSYQHERAINGCEGAIGPSTNDSKDVIENNKTCMVWSGNQTTWKGKISLMYPSDYGFSANIDYWKETKLYQYNNAAMNTSWIYLDMGKDFYWLLSPSTGSFSLAMVYYGTGSIGNHGVAEDSNSYDWIKPVLNLKSNVKITNLDTADGSLEKPYELGL